MSTRSRRLPLRVECGSPNVVARWSAIGADCRYSTSGRSGEFAPNASFATGPPATRAAEVADQPRLFTQGFNEPRP